MARTMIKENLKKISINNQEKKFQIILPSDGIITVEHMVPGSLQKLPICFCFRAERQNAEQSKVVTRSWRSYMGLLLTASA